MLIMSLIAGIFVILALCSFYQGALRALVSFVGLLTALFVTMPLAPLLKPLVPKVGLVHPFWSWVVPPVAVFVVLVLLFTGVGFLVHHKVNIHMKYRTDDYTYARWERLNRRLGACVGLVAAGIYTILVGLIVYMFGYPSVQVVTEDSPTGLRLLSKARQELRDSGLDRTLAALDPLPENYYLASDVIGLLYTNPILQERLLNYPPFLSLGERQEFKDIATDTDLQNQIQTKGPFLSIAKHEKIQAIVNSSEIVDALKQIDLKDLYQYLKTGKSAKYDDEKLLGRWKLDTAATLTLAKKKNPDMPAAQMATLKRLFTIFLSNVSLMATPDNQVLVKMEMSEDAKRVIAAAVAAAAPKPAAGEETAAAPQMDPRIAQRYRQRYGPRAVAAPPAEDQPQRPQRPPPPTGMAAAGVPEVNLNSQGSWQKDGDKYKLKLKSEKGPESTGDATATDDKLVLSMMGQTLVFMR